MYLFGADSYTKLPDEREAARWPHAEVVCLEKLRRRPRWMSRHWSWRTVVLNAYGHLIVYRSQRTGRVYALPTARKITISIKPQLALLHVVDQTGKKVTLRACGPHAPQWAAQLLRYASHTDVEERGQRQSIDTMQRVVQTTADHVVEADKAFARTAVQSVSPSSSAVQRRVSASETSSSWTSLLLSCSHDETIVEKQKPSSTGRSVSDPSKTTIVVVEVYPQSGGEVVSVSRSSMLLSSEETERAVVPMSSRSLSAIETMEQQQTTIESLTPVRTLSMDNDGPRATFVRQLSAILQRQIDSQASASSSTTPALNFSEFKTRGTVQMYRPPPSPPLPDCRQECGPSPMLSADFLHELRAFHRS